MIRGRGMEAGMGGRLSEWVSDSAYGCTSK